MSTPVLFDGLYAQIRDILQAARQRSYRAVNLAMIEAYWQIGRQIVEHEQAGENRAAYGQRILEELAKELSKEFGKGFTASNLRNFRQFYQTFSQAEICDALRSNLTWTHYRQLMRIENPIARLWYLNEAASQGWSARALDRQVSTLF